MDFLKLMSTFKKRLLGIIIFMALIFISPIKLSAQQVYSYPLLDSLTYNHYLSGNWDSVLYYGNIAIKHNIDYNYLRLRMGDAAIEKGKYPLAIKHFNKAIEYSPYNFYGKKQKNLVLRMMGKTDRANQMFMDFSPKLKRSLKKPSIVEFVNFETGYLSSPNLNDDNNLNIMGSDSLFGVQYIMGSQWFMQAGLKIIPSNNFSIYLGFNNINIQSRKDFQYANFSGVTSYDYDWGFARYVDTVPEYLNESYETEIVQNEIYLKAKLQFERGFSFSAFSNILIVKTDVFDFKYQDKILSDTSYYLNSTGQYQLFDYSESDYTFYVRDTSFVNFVAGCSIAKDIDIASFEAFFTYSDFKRNKQTQLGLSALYYPFGKFNFYGITSFIYYSQGKKEHENSNNSRIIVTQKFGVNTLKIMWIDLGFTYGNLTNTNINNGFVVYNLTDRINYKFEAGLKVFVGSHMQFNVRYQFLDKTRDYFSYLAEENILGKTEINYSTNSIIGGVKWIF